MNPPEVIVIELPDGKWRIYRWLGAVTEIPAYFETAHDTNAYDTFHEADQAAQKVSQTIVELERKLVEEPNATPSA